MKKFVFMLVGIVAMLLASCDTGPRFQYDLEVDGQVISKAAPVDCSFNAAATNTPDGIFLNVVENGDVVLMQALPQDSRIVNEFDVWVTKTFIRKALEVNNDAKYKITIKGYLAEYVSGTIIKVDKTFSNIDTSSGVVKVTYN